ncbi:MAG: cache domain-containing protein [Nitrospira sp.]|nr:cache domain-containing protein [Nitrospira sp.]
MTKSAQTWHSIRRDDALSSWRLVMVTIITFVVMVLLAGLSLQYLQTKLIGHAGRTLAMAAVDIAGTINNLLVERRGDIRVLTQHKLFREHNPVAITRHLEWVLGAYRVYQWIGFTDATGHIIAATSPESIGNDLSGATWFEPVRSLTPTDTLEASLSIADLHDSHTLQFTAPIRGDRNEFIGALILRIALPTLETYFTHTLDSLHALWGMQAGLEYQIVNQSGDLLIDTGLREEGKVNLASLGLLSTKLAESSPLGYVEEQHWRRHVEVITGRFQVPSATGE